jgi:hypothetical protein
MRQGVMACWNALFDQARVAFAQQRSAERARAWSVRTDLFGRDPIADISELERVRFVMKDDKVVRNDLA